MQSIRLTLCLNGKLHWRGLIGFFVLAPTLGMLSGCAPPNGFARPPGEANTKRVKISVKTKGLYALTAEDLARLGWENIDPDRLRLIYRGSPHPIWIRGEGRATQFIFYGQPVESRYTQENTYFLQLCPQPNCGLETNGFQPAILEQEITIPGDSSNNDPPAATSYLATQHLEENEHYAPKSLEGYPWYWTSMPAPIVETLEVNLTGLSSGEGVLRAIFFGSTEDSPTNPDHHIRIKVNHTPIADETWDGKGTHLVEAPIPAGALQQGQNIVEIASPGDTGAAADTILLDWIEIDYPRQFLAEEDRLSFTSPGESSHLKGFTTTPLVFDITNPEEPLYVPIMEAPSEGQAILRTLPGHSYITAGQGGFLSPEKIAPAASEPDLFTRTNRADYIVIGPPDLLTPLQPLLEWRESQGLEVMAVHLEAVYDQFNHGLAEPQAIQKFIRYAVNHWALGPEYLLLVGDGSYDPSGFQTPPVANLLPSFFTNTQFGGETASDIVFAKLDEDPYPDIAVGRIPARTPKQVQIMANKTLHYEQNAPQGDWDQRVLAIADGQDTSFRREAEGFLGQFPDGFEPLLYAPQAGVGDSDTRIQAYLEEGALFMAYFGHGSPTMLGREGLFTAEDGAVLNNRSRLPVMVNITCLAGLFTHPEVESLSEVMLWNPDGGAVAALSATSLTTPADQQFLSQALVEAYLENQDATLGQILLTAQGKLPLERPGVREVMDTFLLFGDPALRLVNSKSW